MKKLFSFFCCMLLSIAAWCDDVTATVDGIKYILDGSNATVTYPNDSKPDDGDNRSSYTGDITIPATITVNEVTYNVTELGERAFYRAKINSISLPEGLITIGKKALMSAKMAELTIPNSVTTLKEEAVESCENLTKITVGQHCSDNTWGVWTFWSSNHAYDVYMICDTKPTLSHNETFDNTHNSTIHVPSDLFDAYAADPNWNIYNLVSDLGEINGLYYIKTKSDEVIVTYPNATKPTDENKSTYSGDIVIPATITYSGDTYKVTGIGNYAFRGAEITSITLPEGITSIGDEAIFNTNITKLTLPNSVTTLGAYSLAWNSSLKTITFGENSATNAWDYWVCYRESGPYENIYMKCKAKPSLPDIYTFDSDFESVIHVSPDLKDAYLADDNWNCYTNLVFDLTYTYDDLQGIITSYENKKPANAEVGTDPGYYTASSVNALGDAIDTAKDLTDTATPSQIDNAIKNMSDAFDALETNPLTEGYYFIEDVFNGRYMRSDRNNKDDGGIRAKSLDESDCRFYFKLTKSGNNWIIQCADDNNNVWHIGGPKSYKNENGRCLTITENSLKEQVITWVSGGKFKIQSLYDGEHVSYPYCVSTTWSEYACIYDYAIGSADEDRMYWHFHPATTTDSFKGILSATEVKDKIDNTAGTYLDLSKYAVIATDLTSNMPSESNLLVKVKTGSSVTGTNIINNKTCTNLVLTDAKPFGYKEDITATSATYSRNVTNSFGTICLPFAVSSDDDVQYYTLNKIENNTLYLTKQDNIDAGVPAIFEMKNGTTLTATASDATVKGSVVNGEGDLKLIGTFAGETITTNLENSYFINSNKFWKATNSITVAPFRAYFTTTGSSAKEFNLSTEENETAINNVQCSMFNAQSIYDANGVELQSLRKGLNIVKMNNGNVQKIMVK